MAGHAELVNAYRQGALDLHAAVAGMSREQLLARPVSGQWSTLEVLCHLADFEPIYVDRIKRVLSHDNPELLAADENLFSKHLMYHERDAAEELAVIDATRTGFARILQKLTDEQWSRTGTHSERGIVSTADLLKSAVNHVQHHLKFVVEKKKALGLA
jgi:uncharacterized damage-inducible protein DinB